MYQSNEITAVFLELRSERGIDTMVQRQRFPKGFVCM